MHATRPRAAIAALLVGMLAGCAASTAISKRNLDVQTKMSDSIFLDPVARERRVVYVEVRNTSDRPDLDIEPAVRAAIAGRGYRVVDDPGSAYYLFQANVLQVGRTSKGAAEDAFAGGFGSALVGAAAGAGAGRLASDGKGVMIAGAALGAAAAAAADAYVQDVTYAIVTDVQISERARHGMVITETVHQDLAQGTSGNRILTASETSEWQRYRTRVVSTANRVNLDFEDAAPELVAGLTRSIAGMM